MKTLLSLILSAFIFVSIVPVTFAHEHAEHQQHAQHHEMKTDHACPMHPEVTGKQGDTCPKCGMNLTQNQAASEQHKNCTSCPKHKTHSHEHGETANTHACPMNPSITGKEGDTCPKCGMNLEPMQAKADTKSAEHHKH
ncbi:hypothetical protein GCM10007978_14930 [Shewanella hanedai]|uniref:ATPase P n=1 Tax=Shewanella hanedai TaxID=25 RepID=A0A553JPZ4_SHEHA|nr:heavy metal-binding domain-containing protein [Shewanella hanedai]TRY14539.1 ATPase P [Shewanella hanedai]GGI78253.1 hypothetical protein GCM10007978_14930 [Shewanella hanedai]